MIRNRLIEMLGGTPPLAPGAQQHIAVPNRPQFAKGIAQARGLRRGMWVVVDGKDVGILTGMTAAGLARVQLVEKDGTNRMHLVEKPNGAQDLAPLAVDVRADQVTQAYYRDIPGPRRPTRERARAFRYQGA